MTKRVETLYSEFFSGRQINEDNFDNIFKKALERQIDASISEQLIHEGTPDSAIS